MWQAMRKANASLVCAQWSFCSRDWEVNRAAEMLVQRETVWERLLGEGRSVWSGESGCWAGLIPENEAQRGWESFPGLAEEGRHRLSCTGVRAHADDGEKQRGSWRTTFYCGEQCHVAAGRSGCRLILCQVVSLLPMASLSLGKWGALSVLPALVQ